MAELIYTPAYPHTGSPTYGFLSLSWSVMMQGVTRRHQNDIVDVFAEPGSR